MQEICFARERSIVPYGEYTIPWRELEGILERLRTTAWSTMSGILYPEGRLIRRLIRSMAALHESYQEARHGPAAFDFRSSWQDLRFGEILVNYSHQSTA